MSPSAVIIRSLESDTTFPRIITLNRFVRGNVDLVQCFSSRRRTVFQPLNEHGVVLLVFVVINTRVIILLLYLYADDVCAPRQKSSKREKRRRRSARVYNQRVNVFFYFFDKLGRRKKNAFKTN